jgi:large subunit ribosomal protein L10
VKRVNKEKIVNGLDQAFTKNGTYFLVDFKKMRVAQSVELRKILRKNSYSYQVVKNRLALRSLKDRLPEALKPYFRTTTAIAFAEKDPITLAKILKEYSAGGKVLAVKAGMVEGQYMEPSRFEEIVKLTSRDDLLGRFAFLMSYPMSRFLRTLQAPVVDLGRSMNLLKDKK